MPISEKTVELNVSRTIIEKCRRYHQMQAYSLGATQTEEATFGFDIEVTDGAWSGGFIQYKRLYRLSSGVKRWNLNRTAHRDQHSLLLLLEQSGIPVYYCFPDFDDEATIKQWTPPSLWKQVWWVKPSSIPVPPPIDAHHHVTLDLSGNWQVHSDNPISFDPEDTSFESVERAWFGNKNENYSLEKIKNKINEFIENRWEIIGKNSIFSNVIADESYDFADAKFFSAKGMYMGNLMRGLEILSFQRLEENARKK